MKTVSSLLDAPWYERYKRISRLNIRSSIYDVTNRCNLRCKGCFFFSSDEHQVAEKKTISPNGKPLSTKRWNGASIWPSSSAESRPSASTAWKRFTKELPSFCATNGLIKVPRDRFPDLMVGISLWGDEADEITLRGKDAFSISSKHYAGDPHAYYLYTITPKQLGKTEKIIKKIQDVGLKVHMQLLSNDEGVNGFSWKPEELTAIRAEMDAMLDAYPDTVISSKYYHKIITTGIMLGRALRLDGMPVGHPAARQAYPPTQTAHQFHPLGLGSENHAPLLHLGNPGLPHLQGRCGAHELGHGQQAGPYGTAPKICRTGSKFTKCLPSCISSSPGDKEISTMSSMDPKAAVIIGYDAVSPLGIELAAQWQKAVLGESGIGPLTRFPLTREFPGPHRRAGPCHRSSALPLSKAPRAGALAVADFQIRPADGQPGPLPAAGL